LILILEPRSELLLVTDGLQESGNSKVKIPNQSFQENVGDRKAEKMIYNGLVV
jgi:hypothetical protein